MLCFTTFSELELILTQIHMTHEPVLRVELGRADSRNRQASERYSTAVCAGVPRYMQISISIFLGLICLVPPENLGLICLLLNMLILRLDCITEL